MSPLTVFTIAIGVSVAVGQLRWYGMARSADRSDAALQRKRTPRPPQFPNAAPTTGVPQIA